MAYSQLQALAGGTLYMPGDFSHIGNTSAVGYPSATQPGSLLVMVIFGNVYSPSSFPATAPTLSPSDPTWVFAGSSTGRDATGHTAVRCSLYYKANAASVGPSTLFTTAASCIQGQLISDFTLYEFAGAPDGVIVADQQVATGLQSIPATPNLTLANTDLVMVNACTSQRLNDTGPGYLQGVTPVYSFSQYALNIGPGSIATAFSMVAGYWAALAVAFGPSPTGNIVVRKVTNPAGSPQVFTFTPSYGNDFTLTDGQSNDSGPLTVGSYSVSEHPIQNWTTTVTVNGVVQTSIPVVANQTTTVLFSNAYSSPPPPPPPVPPPPPPAPEPTLSTLPGIINDKLNATSWALTITPEGIIQPVQVIYDPTLPMAIPFVSRFGKERWNLIVENLGAGIAVLQTVSLGMIGRGPQMMLRWSNDGGHTWSNESVRDCGQAGHYNDRVLWNRLGRSRDRVYEIAVTDPVPWSIIDAYLFASPGDRQPQERFVNTVRKRA